MINSVEATKDANDLYMRKGQINVLAYILNLESTTNANYEELNKKMYKIFDFRCKNGHIFEAFVEGGTTVSRCGVVP